MMVGEGSDEVTIIEDQLNDSDIWDKTPTRNINRKGKSVHRKQVNVEGLIQKCHK